MTHHEGKMTLRCLRSLIATILAFYSLQTSAQDIYLLGDSLSDNGQGYAGNAKLVLQTNDTYPQAPYFQGRWSNGVTWIERGANILGKNLFDFGAGGATSGTAPAQVPPLPVGFAGLTVPTITVLSPNLQQQFNSLLLLRNSTLDPLAYYIILIGANDYFSIVFANTTVTGQAVSQNIERTMGNLYSYGARNFILGAGPTLSSLPVFTHPSLYGAYPNTTVQMIDAMITQQNAQAPALIQQFQSSHPGSKVQSFDFGAALTSFIQRAQTTSSIGITNFQDACYVTAPDLSVQGPVPAAQPIGRAGGVLCSDPDAHLFWDQFHLASKANAAIGDTFVSQFGSQFGRLSPAAAPVGAPASLPVLPASGG